MKKYDLMRRSIGSLFLIIGVVGSLALVGCRDPQIEEFPWRLNPNYDPDVPLEGPAPLCPVGSIQTINNSLSPYEGGEVYADLVVEIFTYFRCPNCAGLAMLLKDLFEERQDYRDTVKIYFHHFPLYEHATVMNMHAAGVAIQDQTNEGFWEVHDWVFEHLNKEPPVLKDADDMIEYAENELGLDMNQFDEVYNDTETINLILWDKQQGLDLDVRGTPGIFICGKPVEGGWSGIEEAIESFLN